MAVDTRAKRLSMLAFAGDTILGVNVDGAIDQSDRQTLLGLYGGILAGAAVPAELVDIVFVEMPDKYSFTDLADKYSIVSKDDKYIFIDPDEA